MTELRLYSYFRSSAAYRVRIALNLKKINYDAEFIHLLNDGGQHQSSEYEKINPQKMLPTLHITEPAIDLHQSLAILEYLEETHPSPALLPKAPIERAQVRAMALAICCDIHPLNNLRVLNYLKETLTADKEQTTAWYQHWIHEGFRALENKLRTQNSNGLFCLGDAPTFADICLIPQVYNAQRFGCNLSHFPLIQTINQHCLSLAAFKKASPEEQPDYE